MVSQKYTVVCSFFWTKISQYRLQNPNWIIKNIKGRTVCKVICFIFNRYIAIEANLNLCTYSIVLMAWTIVHVYFTNIFWNKKRVLCKDEAETIFFGGYSCAHFTLGGLYYYCHRHHHRDVKVCSGSERLSKALTLFLLLFWSVVYTFIPSSKRCFIEYYISTQGYIW